MDGVANEDIFGVNREEASVFSTTGIVYSSVEKALAGARDYDKGQSDYYQLLTGEEENDWSLTVLKNDVDAKSESYRDFYKANYQIFEDSRADSKDYNYGIWKSDLQLPASWEYYGFDYSIYTNTTVPWQSEDNRSSANCPAAPANFNPVGLYRKTFTVDEKLKASGGRIYLNLQGVESSYYVYINEKQVGYSEDSFDPHSFDVTDYLQEGENLLAIEVHRFCDGTWFELQDMYKDGGIFRDIYLYSAPLVHIDDYFVTTDLDENYENAVMNLEVKVRNSADTAAEGYKVDVRLYDEEGNLFFNNMTLDIPDIDGAQAKTGNESIIYHANVGTASGSATVYAPKLWSSETPNLYYLVLSLYSEDGVYMGSMAQQHGFREIEFTRTEVDEDGNCITADDEYQQMKLNGERLLFKGVNRHETDPVYGKYVSHEIMEKDVSIMKQYNINSLSTSHYTNDDYMYYLCNKYGIYIMAEPNLECHQLQSDGCEDKKAQCKEMILDRGNAALKQLRNCTAVVAWEDNNECYWSNSAQYADGAFFDLLWLFKNEDGTRPVADGGNNDFARGRMGNGADIASAGYDSLSAVENAVSWKRPWLENEYAHAMGNAMGSLKEYWDCIRASENMLGGFIWDLVDQGRSLELPDSAAYDYYAQSYAKETLYDNAGRFYGYGGDSGEVYHDGNFCQNGLLLPDRTIQPELYEVKYIYQNFWFEATEEQLQNGQIEIYNENYFTDLSDYVLKWELLEDGVSIGSGEVTDAALAPQETKTFAVSYLEAMPENKKAEAEYCLNLSVCTKTGTEMVPANHEVAYEQFQLPENAERADHAPAEGDVTMEETGLAIKVSGDGFHFEINKKTGVIENYYYGEELVLTQGPTPNFWRALVNNDKNYDAAWRDAAKDLKASEIETGKDKRGTDYVEVTFSFPNMPGLKESVYYLIEGNGAVTSVLNIDGRACSGTNRRFLRIGTNLTLPEGYENVTWYGNGPVEAMWDREQFGRIGIYDSTANDLFFPYMSGDGTGTLTGITWFTVTSDTAESAIAIASCEPLECSALHMTEEDMTDAAHPYEMHPQKETYVTVNYRSQGSGNATCGPDVLPEYTLPTNQTYSYTYTILPYTKGADVTELTRSYRKEKISRSTELEAEALNQKIDTLSNVDKSDVEALLAEHEALTEFGKSLVGEARLTKLQEALALAEKVESGEITQLVLDKSSNGFHMDLAQKTEAAIKDGAFYGKADIDNENATAVFGNIIGGSKAFTIEAIAKPNGNGTHNLIAMKGDSCMALRFSGTSADFYICNTSGNWKTARASLNTTQMSSYVHLAGVYDGTNIYLYVDGTLAATVSDVGEVKASNYPLMLCYDPQNTDRVGTNLIRSLHVYAKALSAAEIQNGSVTPEDESVQLWYDFDSKLELAENGTPIAATGIRFDVESVELESLEEKKVVADAIPYYAGEVEWSIQDEEIASVDEKGVVTARKAGSTVLTAAVKGTEFRKKILVTVTGISAFALARKIDAIRTSTYTAGELKLMKDSYEALSEEDKAVVTEVRYQMLLEAAALADGTVTSGVETVRDKSKNQFDLDLTGQTSASVTNGAFQGWANVSEARFNTVFNGTNNFTIDTVLNPNGKEPSDKPNIIAAKGDNCAVMRIQYGCAYFIIKQSDNNWKSINAPLTDAQMNSWTHITGVYTGSKIQLYIDGVLKAQTEATLGVIPNTLPLGIGYDPLFDTESAYARLSWCSIRSMHVFSRALSANEIANDTALASDESAELWYDFDEAEEVYRENGEVIQASGIRTDRKSVKLKVGESTQVQAEAIPYYMGKVCYTVQSEDIATVDDEGIVTGCSLGITTLKISLEGTDICVELPITVNEDWEQMTEDIRKTQEAAEAAQAAAEEAQAAAEAAQAKAEEAQAKSTQAEQNAAAAQAAAEEAQAKALAAQEAAETAAASAEADKEAVEQAKAEALTAKEAAEQAQQNALTSAQQAETAKSQAELAKTDAENAKTQAEAAKSAAELAQQAVEQAKADAETAKTQAEAAKSAAEKARDDALAALDDAQTACDAVIAAQRAAESAKESAEAQANLAEAAKDAAEAAQKAAEAARDEAAEISKRAQEEMNAKLAKAEEERKKAQEEADDKLAKAEAMLKEAKDFYEQTKSYVLQENFKAKKVTILKAKSAKKKTAKITWKKVDGAEGYVLEYALTSNFKKAKTVTVKKGTVVSRTLKKLKSGKSYYVRVKAYMTVNDEKIYTETGAKKKVRIK